MRNDGMNAIRLRYAMDVVRYLRGDINATDAMIEHIIETNAPDIPYGVLKGRTGTVDQWMADRNLTADDFGLTDAEAHEAEDELGCLAEAEAYRRDDDPGSVGYVMRKARMEER